MSANTTTCGISATSEKEEVCPTGVNRGGDAYPITLTEGDARTIKEMTVDEVVGVILRTPSVTFREAIFQLLRRHNTPRYEAVKQRLEELRSIASTPKTQRSMTHAITTLESALRTAENNEPINRREGKVEQADLENQVAIDIRQALAVLRRSEISKSTVGTAGGRLGPAPMQPPVCTEVDWGGAEKGPGATTLERVRLIPHVAEGGDSGTRGLRAFPLTEVVVPPVPVTGTTTDPNDPRLHQTCPNGQAEVYLVLPEEELKSDASERPLRSRYVHGKCGGVTSVGGKIALTFAKDPTFYDTTFCCHCLAQFPVADFTWEGTTDVVGS